MDKSFVPQFKAVGDDGSASWVMARLNVKDSDDDVTLPGAFGTQTFSIVPAHDHRHVPLGKATLREEGDEAIVDAKFNLAIPAAKDWHAAIKFDLENPPAIQEYSYGYNLHEGGWRMGTFKGQRVRFFQPRPDGSPGVDVYESSPVLRGAGLGTRTLAAKSDEAVRLRRELVEIKGRLLDAIRREDVLAVRDRLQLCAIPEAGVAQRAMHWSACASPDQQRQRAAWVALKAHCAALGVDLPLMRFFAEETPAEASYAKRYDGERAWPAFETDEPVRGAWQAWSRTVWVAADLPLKTMLATIAHECAHAAGADEAEAQLYEKKWADILPTMN